VEKALSVYTNDGIVKFQRKKDGLYVYKPSENYLKGVNKNKQNNEPTNLMVQSVEAHNGNLMTPSERGNYTTLLDA
jgi:hypothetical protein